MKATRGPAGVLACGASVVVFLTACYIHTRAHMIPPVIKRPSVCVAAVEVFNAPSDVGTPYVEVARLSVWWPADMVAHARDVEGAVRSKAAELGANGLVRGRLVGPDTVQPRYEAGVAGTAIFLAGDSARAADACAGAPNPGAGWPMSIRSCRSSRMALHTSARACDAVRYRAPLRRPPAVERRRYAASTFGDVVRCRASLSSVPTSPAYASIRARPARCPPGRL
jgi:hypothetical protein